MDERVALPGRVSTLSLVSSRPTGAPAEFFSVFSVWMISPFFVGMTCNDETMYSLMSSDVRLIY